MRNDILHIVARLCAILLFLGTSLFSLVASGQTLSTSTEPSGESMTPSVSLEQQVGCMDESELTQILGAVLDSQPQGNEIALAVVVAQGIQGPVVTLRGIHKNTGEILLDRTFSLARNECASMHLVLRTVTEQFLSSFPLERLPASEKKTALVEKPNPPQPSVSTRFVRESRFGWHLEAAAEGRILPFGGAFTLFTGVEMGGNRIRLVGQGGARLGMPMKLAGGQIVDATPMLALGLRVVGGKRFVDCMLRSGALYVKGTDFDTNYSAWLPWVSLHLAFAWKLGPVWVGPTISVSPLQHQIRVNEERAAVPWLYAGLLLSVPLASVNVK